MSGPGHQSQHDPEDEPGDRGVAPVRNSDDADNGNDNGNDGGNAGTTTTRTKRAAQRTRRLLTLAPMAPRDTEEPHRASTPLELLFDLCFVVAVSQASRELNSRLAHNHFADGMQSYLLVFFAIWWAWVNFTWFASATTSMTCPIGS
jgi:hypothetical protein